MLIMEPKDWTMEDAILEGQAATADDVVLVVTMLLTDPDTADRLSTPIAEGKSADIFECFLWGWNHKDALVSDILNSDIMDYDTCPVDELPY